ncbi:MAG TPA: hypothetical protein VIJ87_10745, partial [Pyrinomonadaceae bacterium]
PNKDGQGIKANGFVGVVDVSYCMPTTAAAGVPSGASLFAGQIQLNTTTFELYRALEKGTTTWAKLN